MTTRVDRAYSWGCLLMFLWSTYGFTLLNKFLLTLTYFQGHSDQQTNQNHENCVSWQVLIRLTSDFVKLLYYRWTRPHTKCVDLAKTLMGYCLIEIFETLYDDNLCWTLHIFILVSMMWAHFLGHRRVNWQNNESGHFLFWIWVCRDLLFFCFSLLFCFVGFLCIYFVLLSYLSYL